MNTVTKDQLKQEIMAQALGAYQSDHPINLVIANNISDQEFNEALFELKKELSHEARTAQYNLDAINDVILGLTIVKEQM